MTPSQFCGITHENIKYASFILRKFVEGNIAYCMTPGARTGRIYLLTEKGRRLRKRMLQEDKQSKEMLEKANASYEFQELNSDTDIDCYRYAVNGKDKREFMLRMRNLARLKSFFTAPEILAFYRREGRKVPRAELYKIMRLFVSAGILNKFKIGKRNTGFRFTRKGLIAAGQI